MTIGKRAELAHCSGTIISRTLGFSEPVTTRYPCLCERNELVRRCLIALSCVINLVATQLKFGCGV